MAESSHSWYESRQLSITQVESEHWLLQQGDEFKHYSTSRWILVYYLLLFESSWIQAVIPPNGYPGCHCSSILIHAVINPSAEIQAFVFLWLKSKQYLFLQLKFRQSLFLQLKSGSHYSFNWNQGGHFPLALIFHLLQAVIIPPNPDSHYSSSNNSGSQYSSKSRKSLFL